MNQFLEEEISVILQEHPSHPPMSGSELGLNSVTVEKLVEMTDKYNQKYLDRIVRRLKIMEEEVWSKRPENDSTSIGLCIAYKFIESLAHPHNRTED